MCYRERTEKAEASEETAYPVGSRVTPAGRYGKAMRDHWRVEDGPRWHPGITSREDASRVQQRTEAADSSLRRKMALSVPKRTPKKQSVAVKRYRAALDPDFLAEILSGSQNRGKA